jgi:hypothetical protein
MTETKKTLEDLGTRFQHLMDLREVWQNGIEAISRIKESYLSKGDVELRASLLVSVAMIDKQVDVMSDYDNNKYNLRREIDAIPRLQPQLTGQTPNPDVRPAEPAGGEAPRFDAPIG